MTTTPPEPGPAQPAAGAAPPRWVLALLLVGVALIVLALVLLTRPVGAASFGWFAYAPESEAVLVASAPWIRPVHVGGLLAVVLGAGVTGAGLGALVAGRRAG